MPPPSNIITLVASIAESGKAPVWCVSACLSDCLVFVANVDASARAAASLQRRARVIPLLCVDRDIGCALS